jgi:carboxyl-terminal processing protease
VQGQVMLFDSSAIRLTIARYYTPTGRCIQRSYKEGTDEYYAQFYERYFDSELENPDSIKINDTLKFKTPKGKIVYGGGGIMPDVFVPLGKDENSKYFTHVYNKGLILQFAFDYSDKNRQAIKNRYNNAQGFVYGFTVNDQMFDDFIAYAVKNGIPKDEAGIAESGENIRVNLKAYIGRNIFSDQAFYPVLKDIDKTLKKAISVIDTLK